MATTMCSRADEGFQCFRPIGHEGPCALAPVADSKQVSETVTPPVEPQPSAERTVERLSEASGAAIKYGWVKPKEYDVRLPSGSIVRLRVLNRARMVELNIMEMLDSFTPELLKSLGDGSINEEETEQALNEAMLDEKRREALLNPVNRVVLASVVCPTVVAEGPTNEQQINVHDVELEDRLAIFGVAFADQVEELKSVRGQQKSGMGDVPESEVFSQATI